MNKTSPLITSVKLPRFFKAKQLFGTEHIAKEKLARTLREQLDMPEIGERIKPGMTIAITAGSRGLAEYMLLLKSIVDYCKEKGAKPFVVPAMGSHGGAEAETQTHILNGYGITEESIGCPIKSSMETVKIGLTSTGRDVFIDKNSAEADGIIVMHRVKPHTCFSGPIQSGIMKMLAIGLAKQYGAERCHERGWAVMGDSIIEYAEGVINNSKMLFALATVENAYDEIYSITSIRNEDVREVEEKLAILSRSLMPSILIGECDVLIVDEIGKNFSGDGMDPNITGTFCTPYASGGVKSQRVCVLRLSPETLGNGIGIGMAQCTTRKCFEELDLDDMYPNSITSVEVGSARIPCIMDNDKEAIQFCVKTLENVDVEAARIVRIPNSQFIGQILLSEHYYEQVKALDNMQIISEPEYLPFDENNNLKDLEPRVREN